MGTSSLPGPILVDICHPAHVHFFRNPIVLWKSAGIDVWVASRDKDVALPLMRELEIEHSCLGRAGSGPSSLLGELFGRDIRLWKLAKQIRACAITAIGGIFAAHAACFARIPSVVFYDTEIARLQNQLTYPLASRVVVPRCYAAWTPPRRTLRYDGYHESSYLHPTRFVPDRELAVASGLDPERPTFLLRLVSWTANHDIGDRGLPPDSVREIVSRLASSGHVVISSECALPDDLAQYRYRGRASDLHHLMAFCAGYFGESATMASECAVLGVPAVYAANSFRGYTDEQESRYGLVFNARDLRSETLRSGLDWLLSQDSRQVHERRQRLLDETIDVAAMVAETVQSVAIEGRR